MNARPNKLIGIEIGGTKLQIAVRDVAGTAEQQFRFTIDAAAGAAGIRTQIEKSITGIGAATIAAAGVGFGGPVHWETGNIQTSHQVEGWAGFNIKQWLQGLIGAPVAVDNDANVAALAEALHGNGVGYDPVFYLTIGSGIGGGLVANGNIYHGAVPGEAEIGHVRLGKEGRTLESACSGWVINKKVRAHVDANPHSLLAGLAAENTMPEATLLHPALERNDEAAQQIVALIADDLAFALSHVVHLFHPQTIIIGGGVSLLGEHLRLPVSQQLPQYVMKAFLPVPVIQLAALQENAVPAGALELAKKTHEANQGNRL